MKGFMAFVLCSVAVTAIPALARSAPATEPIAKEGESSSSLENRRPEFGWTIGGFYTTGSTYCAAVVNPWTGGLTCPAGFEAQLLTTAVCNSADSVARSTYLCVR